MKVLVGCESSGAVRRAFAACGHDAWSCDLLAAQDGDPKHIQGDVLAALAGDWDLAILHPPCTYLSVSGLHWNHRRPERAAQTEAALQFVRDLWAASAHVPKVCTENPIGVIGTRLMPASQIVQPYSFGADASKATCLWLRGLPKLRATKYIEPRMVDGRPRWGNQTDTGQNRLAPSADRWQLRSQTYPGIAAAMADQWGAQ